MMTRRTGPVSAALATLCLAAAALRGPKILNIRSDPFERAEVEAGGYVRWYVDHMFVLLPAQQIVGEHLATPAAGSFSIDKVMEMLMETNRN